MPCHSGIKSVQIPYRCCLTPDLFTLMIINMNISVLVVDDNVKLCETLSDSLEARGYSIFTAMNIKQAKETVLKNNINIVLLDLRLGEEDGMNLLHYLTKENPQLPVIIITAFGSIEIAIEAVKNGAFDLLEKPVKLEQLISVIKRALEKVKFEHDIKSLPDKTKLLTEDTRLIEVLKKIETIAASDLPIMLCGETGTGKDLIAEFIHDKSIRAACDMVKLNCASLSDSLLENELFGHEKGAYTGASGLYKGVFEQADRSSIFLDEIGEMPLNIQAKILRTIQNNEIRRLGGRGSISISVRFIGATHGNLEQLVSEGRFREDLFYRLNAGLFYIPPLRERICDIILLSNHFVSKYNDINHSKISISNDVISVLVDYKWPGNIRELKNVISFACTITKDNQIKMTDLPPYFNKRIDNDRTILENNEKHTIETTLKMYSYNKQKTAKALGISRTTLYSKMEKYGIELTKALK